MATKKQKRALGEARAKEALEQTRLSGLMALEKDRARRQKKKDEQDAEEKARKAGRVLVSMASGPIGEGTDGDCN